MKRIVYVRETASLSPMRFTYDQHEAEEKGIYFEGGVWENSPRFFFGKSKIPYFIARFHFYDHNGVVHSVSSNDFYHQIHEKQLKPLAGILFAETEGTEGDKPKYPLKRKRSPRWDGSAFFVKREDEIWGYTVCDVYIPLIWLHALGYALAEREE